MATINRSLSRRLSALEARSQRPVDPSRVPDTMADDFMGIIQRLALQIEVDRRVALVPTLEERIVLDALARFDDSQIITGDNGATAALMGRWFLDELTTPELIALHHFSKMIEAARCENSTN